MRGWCSATARRSAVARWRGSSRHNVVERVGAALNVYTPVAGGGAKLEKTVHFHDGFVSWTVVRNGGFDADGEPLAPTCLHSVDSAVPSVEFREYLIELK